MFTSYLSRVAVMVILASGLVVAARADGTNDNDEIDGTEELHLEVVLTATTNAPSGANGSIRVDLGRTGLARGRIGLMAVPAQINKITMMAKAKTKVMMMRIRRWRLSCRMA